jgi:hypothetical protein
MRGVSTADRAVFVGQMMDMDCADAEGQPPSESVISSTGWTLPESAPVSPDPSGETFQKTG